MSSLASPVPQRRSRIAVPQIYSELLAQIVSMRLEPGAALSESRIADSYGVSRTPVREAFKRLAEDGFLDVIPQVGTFVARIELQAIRDAHFVRETLECRIAELAATNIDADGRRELARNIRELAAAQAAGDHGAHFLADEAMHAMLARFAGHRDVWQLIRIAKAQLDRVRQFALSHPRRPRETVREHRAIADRVAAGDAAGAAEAMRAHLATVIDVLEDIAGRHPQYFVERGSE
ncbi:MAG TPA: GntR family transcriptional regulator [Burkholderiaceae bacterium]|nr:GntR family transcriptional regulator [Burkholderiaceae bacterium]